MRWIVGDAIPLQEFHIFLFEILLGMMRRLVRNVIQHAFGVGCADTERPITFLPGEIIARGVSVIKPFGET